MAIGVFAKITTMEEKRDLQDHKKKETMTVTSQHDGTEKNSNTLLKSLSRLNETKKKC